MLKKISVALALIIGFIVIGGIGAGIWYFSQTSAPSSNAEKKSFVITKGSSAAKIAKDLKEAGLIKDSLAFRVYTKINGIADNLPPGQFSIPQNLDLEQLIGLFRAGPTQFWVTIPEGLRREEIASRVADALEKDQSFIQEFLALTENDEGYLFPDTYLFPKEVTAQAVVTKLKSTYDSKVDFPVTQDQLTLASILERETKNATTEGPIVAGILLKRANAGWRIDADATVQYAAGSVRCGRSTGDCDWWKEPTGAELEINSPYNTRLVAGFPPAPIASPGLAAITAAANPEESEYWYYLHGNDGQIHYAQTLEEHNQNVARYIR